MQLFITSSSYRKVVNLTNLFLHMVLEDVELILIAKEIEHVQFQVIVKEKVIVNLEILVKSLKMNNKHVNQIMIAEEVENVQYKINV